MFATIEKNNNLIKSTLVLMANTKISAAAFADTKPHYNILNGYRGVAAITVVCFHLFEAFATSHLDQRINHGYLAVDFFFILSGFVIGYAYDDRWDRMSIKEFMKRRIIRLQPLIVLGAIIGAIMFYTQGCSSWDVSKISISLLLISTLLNALLIPSTTGFEIRGVGEMYPLNGPCWTLLFEYIGCIMYALFLRKLPTRTLFGLVLIAGIALITFSTVGLPILNVGGDGDICVGYSLTTMNFTGGFLRILFSFSAGLFLTRVFKPVKVRGAFWIGSIAIVLLSSVPRLGGAENLWMNGLYDSLCVIILFPILICLGASGETTDKSSTRICKFLGDISYPLYIVHYPFIYLYFAWVKNENLTFTESLPGAIALVVGSIVLAYLALKLFDIPVRRYLTKRFLTIKKRK